MRLTSAVCPVWGVLEPYLETSAWPWLKFLNNDGIPVGDGGSAGTWPASIKEMQLKAESFAHWTLDKFKGRAFVCDLQGQWGTKLFSLKINTSCREHFVEYLEQTYGKNSESVTGEP